MTTAAATEAEAPPDKKRIQVAKPLNDEQRAVILALQKKRGELGMSDSGFHKKHLPGSYSTWHRMQHNKYSGDIQSVIDTYILAFKNICESQKIVETTSAEQLGTEDFHHTDTADAVFNTISLALNRTDELRVVILKAPFGFGKSAICTEIARRHHETVIVRAHESWESSYAPGPKAICKALGLDEAWRSIHAAETAMLTELRRKRRVLCIDDANTLAPSHCNMVRDIINETQSVVFLALIPAFFSRLRHRAFWQAEQMISRSLAVIPANQVKPADVARFLRNLNMESAGPDAAKLIANAANQYAGFRMVKRIRDRIIENVGTEAPIDIAHVIQAISESQAALSVNAEL